MTYRKQVQSATLQQLYHERRELTWVIANSINQYDIDLANIRLPLVEQTISQKE